MADSGSSSVWEQKGCHIVGHTQRIDIPGCINFELTSNACRGYCLSYAIPSNQETLLVNDQQMITSVGNCCAMTETEVVSFLYENSECLTNHSQEIDIFV